MDAGPSDIALAAELQTWVRATDNEECSKCTVLAASTGPVVVRGCKPASAALRPGPGERYLPQGHALRCILTYCSTMVAKQDNKSLQPFEDQAGEILKCNQGSNKHMNKSNCLIACCSIDAKAAFFHFLPSVLDLQGIIWVFA